VRLAPCAARRARGAVLGVAPLLFAALLAAGCARPAGRVFRTPDGAEVRGDPRRGEELFGQKGCNGCHTINGVGGQVGPNLTLEARRDLATERPGRTWPNTIAYMRESIKTPQAYIVPTFPNPSPMPGADQFKLSEQDINDLIAYLFSVAEGARRR
jgi:mono/diheme cytochrome c family protein